MSETSSYPPCEWCGAPAPYINEPATLCLTCGETPNQIWQQIRDQGLHGFGSVLDMTPAEVKVYSDALRRTAIAVYRQQYATDEAMRRALIVGGAGL